MSAGRRPPVGAARDKWTTVSLVGLAAYGGLAFACALFGRTNDDEGWYLYAAHLAWRGSLPYRDFAFTQMPLMPYVYGLPQRLLGESLYVGRATSVVLAVAAATIAVRIAWRRAGPLAGAIAAVLLVGMPFAVYASAIVKTYALLGLLLTATLWALTAELAAPIALGLAVTFASAAALTRLSAVPFAAIVVGYAFVMAGRHWRWAVIAPAVLLGMGAVALVLAAPGGARYDVLSYHTAAWPRHTLQGKVSEVLFSRVPSAVGFYRPQVLLLVVALFVGWRLGRWAGAEGDERLPRATVVFGVALAAFVASHFLTGQWHVEYLAPAIPPAFSLAAVPLARAVRQRGPASTLVAAVVLATVAVTVLSPQWAEEGRPFFDWAGRRSPIARVNEVGEFVAAHTRPHDRVLVLAAQTAAVAAHRDAMPNMSMAEFSYVDASNTTALAHHYVDASTILRYLEDRKPGAVVFVDGDWDTLSHQSALSTVPADPAPIRSALDRGYEPALVRTHFGQGLGNVTVYLPRPAGQPS